MTGNSISNPVVELLKSHRSVRAYEDRPVPEEICQAILEAAFAASSSCFMQVTSVIRVKDPVKREKLSVLAGHQKHVALAPEFWVFVADYHRNTKLAPDFDLGWSEQLLVGCTDTAIVAQNAFVAMESFGLGGLYVGGLRNGIAEVAELLELPEHTLPLFGFAFGWPAEDNEQKPRLPMPMKVFIDKYEEVKKEDLAAYDRTLGDYFAHRRSHPKQSSFTQEVSAIMKRERRPFVDAWLKKFGWLKG